MSRTFRVTAAYQRSYPDPLCARAGDLLVLGEEDDEHPGWIWAADPEDRSGWVPIDLPEPVSGAARYDYSAAELDARQGDIRRRDEERAGWGRCVNEAGEQGWVPLANLEPAA